VRLGARWRAGDPPHPGVPEALHAEIAAQEAKHPAAASWTLTWLEGRPRCELDGPDGLLVTVTLSPAGAPATEDPPGEDDDDWLE